VHGLEFLVRGCSRDVEAVPRCQRGGDPIPETSILVHGEAVPLWQGEDEVVAIEDLHLYVVG
jgi:hypothetical protein